MVPGSGVLTSPVVKTSEPSGLTSTDVAKLSQGAPRWKEPRSHSCAPVAASYATVLNAAAPEKPDASPAANTFDPSGLTVTTLAAPIPVSTFSHRVAPVAASNAQVAATSRFDAKVVEPVTKTVDESGLTVTALPKLPPFGLFEVLAHSTVPVAASRAAVRANTLEVPGEPPAKPVTNTLDPSGLTASDCAP